MTRLVVAQERLARAPAAKLGVGIAFWPHPWTASVVVKIAYALGANGETPRLLAEQQPPSIDRRSELDQAGSGELAYGTDFVVHKPRVDLMVTGHAHAREPRGRIDVVLRADDWTRRLVAVSREPRTDIPLSDRFLRRPDDAPSEGLAPRRVALPEPSDVPRGEEPPWERGQQAPPAGQLEALPEALELEGLSAKYETRRIPLPPHRPRVVVEARPDDQQELRMRCDTLWIDSDFDRLVMVWRGIYAPPQEHLRLVDRLVLWLDDARNPREHHEAVRQLAHGHFFFARHVEDRDAAIGDADELELARVEALEHAPDPQLELPRYAQVGAELAEQKEERDDVLARHDLDEFRWMVEERAWSQRFADTVERGDGRLAVEYGELFVAAQDALASDGEPRAVSEYAGLKASLEGAERPDEVLKQANIGLGEWMRLDRHWTSRAADDADVARELEALLADARGGQA